jgi:hypothetical protein
MTDSVHNDGHCPFCESDLSGGGILIAYEVNGERRVFVECPACEQPVAPC